MSDKLTQAVPSPQTTAAISAYSTTIDSGRDTESCFPQWMINITLSGRSVWCTQTAEYIVEPGQIVLTRPNCRMAWRVPKSGIGESGGVIDTDWDTIYSVFHPRPHWLTWLDAIDFHEGMAYFQFAEPARTEISSAMRTLAATYASASVMRDERALHALENVLLSLYTYVTGLKIAQDERIRAAIEYIHLNYAKEITVRNVSRAAGLSESHCAGLFKSSTGVTLARYIENVRLARATEMLGFSAVSVREAAIRSGFCDPNYFARRFRLFHGQTPTEYREFKDSTGTGGD